MLAVPRRDVAGAVPAGTAFVVPPVAATVPGDGLFTPAVSVAPAVAPGVAIVVALLGLALLTPWPALIGQFTPPDLARTVGGLLQLASVGALGWLVCLRHPRVGVYVAAAYASVGALASALGVLLVDPAYPA